MNFISFFLLLITIVGFTSCSSNKGTAVNLKVRIAGLGTLPPGIGDGGAMLYGRSNEGKLFGKRITLTDEVLDIPNGQWTFYTILWDSTNTPLYGTVYCGKSQATLSGRDITVSLSANNANCTDPEFSNGQTFINGNGKNQFADIFLEDCDELPASGYTCGLLNQGNALSYRFVLSEFKKDPSIPFLFSPINKQYSTCQVVDELSTSGSVKSRLPINFPLGNGVTPFVAQVQLFFGSTACDETDLKGNQIVNLSGAQSLGVRKMVSNQFCDTGSSAHYATGDQNLNESRCRDDLGSWNVGSCTPSSFPETIKRFMPASQCTTMSTVSHAIKFLIAVPKSNICDRYLNQSSNIGSHAFASGDGSRLRPYKICTEWQLNQIGEVLAPISNSNKWYKLLNDLDMNKVGFGSYAFPSCSVDGGVVYERYNNFNPIDKAVHSNCSTVRTSENLGFQGEFNGNGKTVLNLRLNLKNVDMVGFTRELYSGARIYNINFKNADVEAKSKVAVLAGKVHGTGANLSDISVENSEIRAKENGGSGGFESGSATGWLGAGSAINNFHGRENHVEAKGYAAGLVGQASGDILNSSFSGTIYSFNNSNATINVAGIAALLVAGGNIKKSFSEGYIFADSNRVGGITGQNGGNITDSYSSMIITQKHQFSSQAKLGGVAAANTGTITRALFMGSLKQESISPLATNSVTDTGSVTTSYGISSSGSTTAGSSNPEINFKDGSIFGWMGSPIDWISLTNGSILRLSYESRPCQDANNQASILTQISLSRGSAINPIAICNIDQFKNIGVSSAGRFYKILEDIDLSSFTIADQIANFSGTLLGNGRFLYGLNMNKGSDGGTLNLGIFRVNDGVVNNLKSANNSFFINDPDDVAGIIVGQNNGSINNVSMFSSSLTSLGDSGLIAGLNNGTISNSRIKYSKISSDTRVGGVVGENSVTGVIKKVSANVSIYPQYTRSNFNTIGGITGTNNGAIEQVSFNGDIKTTALTTYSSLYLGGIAGTNSGSIADVLVSKYARINIVDTLKVGGIAGRSAGGSITRAVFLGKLLYDNAGTYAPLGDPFHSLVGFPSASTFSHLVTTNSTIASVIANNTAGAVSGAGPYVVPLVTAMPGKTDVAALSNDKLDGVSINTNNSGFIYPYSLSSDHTLQVDLLVNNGDPLNLFKLYPASSVHTSAGLTSFMYSIPQIFDHLTYCPGGFSGAAGFEKCNTGFDIVYEDLSNSANNLGFQRLLNYYLAEIKNEAIPLNSPVWSIDSDSDEGPRLLQVDD